MLQSSENLLEKAYQAALKINQAVSRCGALTRIAEEYCQNGGKAQAETILGEALKTAEAVKYPHEKAKVLAAIAAVFSRIGKFDRAREQFSRAVLLARAAESPSQTLEALYRVAGLYREATFSQDSLNLLEEIGKLAIDPANNLDSAAELVNVAELYDDLGKKEQASSILSQALALAEKIPDKWFRLERLIEIADTYCTIGDEQKALPILSESALIVDSIEEYSRPYFLLRLAQVCIFLSKNSEAAEILKTIPDFLNSEENIYERAGGLIEVAEKYLEIAQNVAAVELIVRAISLAEKVTDPKEKIGLQTEAAEWLDEAGHLDEARRLAALAYLACQKLADKKSSLYSLGNLAILFVYLKDSSRAGQIIDEMTAIIQRTSAKTSGLGAIGEELAIEGQCQLALRLAETIKEPEVLVNLLCTVVKYLPER